MARAIKGGRPMEFMMHRKKYVKKRDITQYNSSTGKFHCPNCNNGYGRRDTMLGHYRYECGKAPRYKCPYCNLCSKKTSNIYQHVRCMHPKEQVTLVKLY
ncbi:Longitudinals lacking protein, isoforms A/B/D/L [Trachymyrmex cornetzi]|uniref:Longitudinals lacking protein, isoforms A/B/D/L n=1 Tax=Trachymyrmex cornetzi TaxID=471704 RepID=A0A195E323_9HYME|nr:Longitudinals lacking protein, isoforms A/B/D/L [Trachymyrmex cornetzi]